MIIRHRYTGEVIFSDDAKTMKETVEDASFNPCFKLDMVLSF